MNLLERFQHALIESGRIILRPMAEGDAENIVRWRNDPDIGKWLFASSQITQQSHREWFHKPKLDRLDFIICLRATMQPIGTVNFTNIDFDLRHAEAGKLLGEKAYQRQGLAKEAFREWLKFGFTGIGFDRVFVRTRSANTGNIRLNEALGFRVVGDAEHPWGDTEAIPDSLVMRLTREDALRLGLFCNA